MKIQGNVPAVTGIYDKNRISGRIEKPGSVPVSKDAVSISAHAKDFQTIMRALKDIPDIRQDLVNTVKEKYQSGLYEIRGKDIAGKILGTLHNKSII